ncbi:unnamed protein product [Effrenium voratum]|uniref:Uncharacterized protein n=1 Tax=Effrenium voratum TaxID=2562239 RepID=A0AA36J1K1_9DINO|nr:unnamed protein product [Effrenium voratum]
MAVFNSQTLAHAPVGACRERTFTFSGIQLANSAWGFSWLNVSGDTFRESAAAAAKTVALDPQSVGALIDAGIKSEALENQMLEILGHLLEVLPGTSEQWDSASPGLFMDSIPADTLGVLGTSGLLRAWSVKEEKDIQHPAEEAAARHFQRPEDMYDWPWAFLEWEADGARGAQVLKTGFSSAEPGESEAWWSEAFPLRSFKLGVRASAGGPST